jgi:hypothetical protein
MRQRLFRDEIGRVRLDYSSFSGGKVDGDAPG